MIQSTPVRSRLTSRPKRIVLVAGPVKTADKSGHHDYTAGCRLLAELLSRVPDVEPVVATGGWPTDDSLLEHPAAMVFYDRGGGGQGFLSTPERMTYVEQMVQTGTGIVMMHQAVGFPATHLELGKRLLGGVYISGESARGHWNSDHRNFPEHPITRGVAPWNIFDGWLNGIVFNDGLNGVVPLLWSGRRFAGSAEGGDEDIVSWAYERSGGGRSFAFTGLDAHSAWSHAGLRRLIVNGILWAAGMEVPETGAAIDIEGAKLRTYLTPRRSRLARLPLKLWRRLANSPRW